MIKTVLIANRGEIACRVIRTCRRLGIRTVAVYSEADARALHVTMADEAIALGPAPAGESYLVIEKVIAAALRSAADAIHPGFGFLAENSAFAAACGGVGLIFIGPTPLAMESMGNKRAAREMVARAGVPILPGYGGDDQTDASFQREAELLGWPVMVKAAAGGGGKGMRFVQHPRELLDALSAARREAGQAFGSDELILERAVLSPRHIEFQVFGDQHGNLIHLGERECSLQRRHQKVIEEAPAIGLPRELRSEMGEAALKVANTVSYTNAGTVEFLLDRSGRFYFLEMNTRLQVEHPVTELVTGLDLVEWQIRVAEGRPLPLHQTEITMRGHAIEARLYAENPANQFLPVTGEIALWKEPTGEGIRVESGIQSGDEVSIYYDPLLAKVIAWGSDRELAIRRLQRALASTSLLGLTNNQTYLQAILELPAYQQGKLSTDFLSEHLSGWSEAGGDLPLALIAATLARWRERNQPTLSDGYWRNNPNRAQIYRFRVDGSVAADTADPIDVFLTPSGVADHYTISLTLPQQPTLTVEVELHPVTGAGFVLTVDGYRQRVVLARQKSVWWVQTRMGLVRLRELSLLPEPKAPADAGGSLRAPMPGAVLAVLVQVGQRVARGDPLLKLEAMKMEHTIRTAADGTVEEIYFGPGATVAADELLVKLKDE
jgi:acetyl-CoA carboxylase biotin carboxylase subunit